MPRPAVGTARWRDLRPAWFALLTVVLVPMVIAVMRAERPVIRLPAGLGTPGPWSPVLLVAGLAASMLGLARLAIAGFAPGGRPCSPAAPRPQAPSREPSARSSRSSRRKEPESESGSRAYLALTGRMVRWRAAVPPGVRRSAWIR